MDKVQFWVVTKPTPNSELEDICFLTDVRGIMLQALGGLHPDSIVKVFPGTDTAKAHRYAHQLLSQRVEP